MDSAHVYAEYYQAPVSVYRLQRKASSGRGAHHAAWVVSYPAGVLTTWVSLQRPAGREISAHQVHQMAGMHASLRVGRGETFRGAWAGFPAPRLDNLVHVNKHRNAKAV